MKIFIPLLFVLSFSSLVYPQTVSNVQFEPYPDSIVVYYDLQGDANQEYNVSLTLRREEFITSQFVPKQLRGDIGDGIVPGLKRRIVWDPTHEYIITPNITDYYFEVKASIASGGLRWYYYAAAVMVGGGAAALLLSGKKTSGGEAQVAIGAPPLRP